MSLIKPILDKHLGHLIYKDLDNKERYYFDRHLAKHILKYDVGFVNKNSEHVDFFGGALLGVQRVLWTKDDMEEWLMLLGCNDVEFHQDIMDLPESIHPKDGKGGSLRKVQMNIINQSIFYLIHGAINDISLPSSDKEKIIKSLIRIIHYKFITSLIQNYFSTHLADRQTAEAAFNELNNTFDIKKLGSWTALLEDRANVFYSKRSIHYEGIKNLNDDKKFLYAISDYQTRIRRLIIVYFNILDKVTKNKSKILQTSSIIDTDDGLMVKDITIERNKYYRYTMSIMGDERSFIKDELMFPLMDMNRSARQDKVLDILKYLSKNSKSKEVITLTDDLLIYVFAFMRERKYKTSQLNLIITNLKNMLTGSKIKTPEIINLRAKGDEIAKKGANYSNTSAVSTERTVVLLYIALRALTMNKYK